MIDREFDNCCGPLKCIVALLPCISKGSTTEEHLFKSFPVLLCCCVDRWLACVVQTLLAQRNQELQVMVDQAASRPQTGNAGHTAPFMRVDLREETVTEHATPGNPCVA